MSDPTIEDEVTIARVVKARGIRGEVVCESMTNRPGRFEELDYVSVALPDKTRQRLRIERFWFQKDRVVIKLDGINSRNEAEKLVGARLLIPSDQTGKLEDGEFFEHTILGLEVVMADGRPVGRVERLMHTGGTDLLVVVDESAREYLIPFVDSICPDVDVANGRIRIEPPEGLLDL